jgi:hypothetical protein
MSFKWNPGKNDNLKLRMLINHFKGVKLKELRQDKIKQA